MFVARPSTMKARILTSSIVAGTDAMMWTLIEPGVAIVAASLATTRPLLRAMRLKGFESTGRTGKSADVRSGVSNRSRQHTIDDIESRIANSKRGDRMEMNPLPGHDDFSPTRERFGSAMDMPNMPGIAITTDQTERLVQDSRTRRAASEMFVIEGERTKWTHEDSRLSTATPYSDEEASTRTSSVDIIGMNPTGQHGPLGHSTGGR